MGLLLFFTSLAMLGLAVFLWISSRYILKTPNSLLLFFMAAIAYVIPAIFFWMWTLATPSDASRFRLALRGLGLSAQNETQRFTIGGDPKKHDIWIPQLPRRHAVAQTRSRTRRKKVTSEATAIGVLKLTPGTATQAGTLTLIQPNMHSKRYWPPPALLLTKRGRNYDSPFAIDLQDGDKLVYDGTEWLITIKPNRLTLGFCPPFGSLKNKIVLNDPPTILPLRHWCVAYSFTARTHPLHYILNANTASPLGLIYRKKTSIGLFALSPKVELWRDNIRLKVPTKQSASLKNGSNLHVFMLPKAKHKYDSLQTEKDEARYWAGLHDVRSFTVKTGQTHTLLDYHTPKITSLSWDDLKLLAIQQNKPDTTNSNNITNTVADQDSRIRISLAMGDWYITDQSLQFSNISNKIGHETFAMLEFPEGWSVANNNFGPWHSQQAITIASSGGRTKALTNTPFWVGEQRLAAFQFDLLTPPGIDFIFLIILLAFFKTIAATKLRLSAAQLFIASMLELLVLFRFILAYRVWIMPPDSEEAMRWALIVWSLLPWAYLAASMPANYKPQDKRQSVTSWHLGHIINYGAIGIAGGLLFSGIWCWYIIPEEKALLRMVFAGIHGLIAGIFLLPWNLIVPEIRSRLQNSAQWLGTKWQTIRIQLSSIRQRIKMPQQVTSRWNSIKLQSINYWQAFRHRIDGPPLQALGKAGNWTYQRCVAGCTWVYNKFLGTEEQKEAGSWLKYWLLWSLAFFAGRGFLLAFGQREAISAGGRLALSIVHIPLALVLEGYYLAWLWHRFSTNRMHWYDVLSVFVMTIFVWLLPAVLASDNGLLLQILIFGIPLLVFLVIAWKETKEHAHGFRLGFSKKIYMFMGLGLVVLIVFGGMNLHHLIDDWRFDNNYLRLLRPIDSQQVSEIGGKSSEELTIMSKVLQTYTRDNFWGRGYTASELNNNMKTTSTSDHATAVWIASEWGRIGVIGLGLLYASAIYLGLLLAPWRRWYRNLGVPPSLYRDMWLTIAGLTILSIGFTSLYMTIANHDWLFFTGKNVYLFGLESGSDVLESLVLFSLFTSAATVASKLTFHN